MNLDNHKLKGMRRILIEELREKGINDERILDAFDVIHRHLFLDKIFVNQAYSNVAFQIGAGQTISHPYTVAFQTQLLNIQKRDKVLEIGTGSAFQTCILCQLGAKVYTIERQRELFLKANEIIRHFNFSPIRFFGDGYKGQEAYAPYDKILITCGAPYIPEALLKQLKIGGILVIPVGDLSKQQMLRITKTGENTFTQEQFGEFSFVPMLEDKSK